MRRYNPSRRRVEHIRYMVEVGCCLPEICDLFGIPREAVERVVKEYGLALSNSGAQTHRGLRKGNIFDAERKEKPLPRMLIDEALDEYRQLKNAVCA